MKNQKGFSLIELLVVVIIIAIIAAIAIPSLLASRRAANEASAISSIRTVHAAQTTYFATTGANNIYAPNMAALGTGGLVDPNLSAGVKSGYDFTTSAGAANSNLYCADAEATTQGTTGIRSFAVATDGVIYEYAAAGGDAACAAGGVLTVGAGTALD